jgi:adenosylcobinamide-GDP ribazoletransferase
VITAFPLVPLVGWATGAVTGLLAIALFEVVPAEPLAALLLAALIGLTGLNATDGLLDLGDGLMVHGDVDRRLAVMHDHSAGVGAVALVLFTYLGSYAGLVGILELAGSVAARRPGPPGASPEAVAATAIVLAEVLARTPYVFLAWRGRASHGGLGAAFLEGFAGRHASIGALVAAPALLAGFWLGWPAVLLALLAALLVGIFLLRTANRLLGGVGGDVFGASQELARAAVLWALTLGMGLQVRI